MIARPIEPFNFSEKRRKIRPENNYNFQGVKHFTNAVFSNGKFVMNVVVEKKPFYF